MWICLCSYISIHVCIWERTCSRNAKHEAPVVKRSECAPRTPSVANSSANARSSGNPAKIARTVFFVSTQFTSSVVFVTNKNSVFHH